MYVPPNPWTSIVQGAVLCGVERDTVSSLKLVTPCRYSYAINLHDLFPDHTFTTETSITAWVTPEQDKYAKPELLYMLDEGDIVFADEERVSEQEFHISFSESPATVVPFHIYRYQGQDRPTRFNFHKNGMSRYG